MINHNRNKFIKFLAVAALAAYVFVQPANAANSVHVIADKIGTASVALATFADSLSRR